MISFQIDRMRKIETIWNSFTWSDAHFKVHINLHSRHICFWAVNQKSEHVSSGYVKRAYNMWMKYFWSFSFFASAWPNVIVQTIFLLSYYNKRNNQHKNCFYCCWCCCCCCCVEKQLNIWNGFSWLFVRLSNWKYICWECGEWTSLHTVYVTGNVRMWMCAFTNNIDLYTVVVVTVVAVVVLNAYTGDAAKCFLFPSLRSYRIRHPRGLTFGFFTTARTASWNTSSRLCFFFAEHSTSAKARILCFNFLPSASVTNFSEFGTRRSLFVPAKWRENCHVIMNSHTSIYSI